jgi:predicted alpha/beta hydrolase family esterase
LKKDKTPFLLKAVRWIFPKLERVWPSAAHRYFIRIFFTPLNYTVPEKEMALQQTAEKFYVRFEGKKIQCYSWGNGPLVMVMHGWAGRATQFRKFIEVLTREGFCVVGFDGPAHGNSEGRTTNIAEFDSVLRLLYEKVGEPEAIIAHSFGGSVILYAAMNGLRVKKLINIASPTIGDEIINTYLKAINGSWQTGNFFKSYILEKYGKPFDEFTALYFIRHIAHPPQLLLVHDTDDKEVSIKHAEQLVSVFPQADLLKTSGLGHTRILKDDAVIRQCVTFIKNERLDINIKG